MERSSEECFVNMVTDHPYLYDKKEKLFKNSRIKDRTWAIIGQTFGITGDEAVKYFKSLREKYLRIKREREKYERSGAGAYHTEKWHLFELLRFLDEVARPRRTISNVIKQHEHTDTATTYETESQTSQECESSNDDSSQSHTEGIAIDIDATVTSEELATVASPVLPPVDVTSMAVPSTSSSSNSTPLMNRNVIVSRRSKQEKIEEKVSTALQNIANSLQTQPENEYVHAFCAQLEQELLHMPKNMMEDIKADIIDLVLKKRRKLNNM